MRPVVRILLLFFVAVSLVLPMAGLSGAPGGAQAATRPCPGKPVVKACVIETPSDAVAPRGTATVDAPCQGKAIGVEGPAFAVPTACGPLAFDVASASWAVWSPPTPARPPRS